MNLNLTLREVAHRFGSKAALVSGDSRLSYADLDQSSDKLANALMKMGVNKGDRVVILLPNGAEFVTSYFGTVKTGAIAVPLDNNYKIDELSCLLDD
ncbi:MAG: AMP-binding protein, partial [Dehalococcoidales bacterium]|nr:AMP-binding protein [Dehalococcoidales bacterium]